MRWNRKIKLTALVTPTIQKTVIGIDHIPSEMYILLCQKIGFVKWYDRVKNICNFPETDIISTYLFANI